MAFAITAGFFALVFLIAWHNTFDKCDCGKHFDSCKSKYWLYCSKECYDKYNDISVDGIF